MHETIGFASVCRTCLSKEFHLLNPIFKSDYNYRMYSTAVFTTTGLKVEPNDGLPQLMCTKCIQFINNSLLFRKQCKTSHEQLLLYKHNNHLVTDTQTLITNDLDNDLKKEFIKIEYVSDANDDLPLIFIHDNNIENTEDTITNTKIKQNENFNTEIDEVKQEQMCQLESSNDMLTEEDKSKLDNVKPKRVMCKVCGKDLSIRSINMHMKNKHPDEDVTWVKCDLCDTFVLERNYDKHKMQHGSDGFKCERCRREFDNKQSLMDHSRCCGSRKDQEPSRAGRALVKCEVCDKEMQRASLRMHLRIQHAGLAPVCEHCGRRFGNKNRLQDHLRARHGYDKFKCTLCDFQSANVMAMRNHSRRHSGLRPYVCESCGASFHAAYLLAQHRYTHRTDRPVQCNQCPATFKANNGLYTHRASCHGPARYRSPPPSPTRSRSPQPHLSRPHSPPLGSNRSHLPLPGLKQIHSPPLGSNRSRSPPLSPIRSRSPPLSPTRLHSPLLGPTRPQSPPLRPTRFHSPQLGPPKSQSPPQSQSTSPNQLNSISLSPTRFSSVRKDHGLRSVGCTASPQPDLPSLNQSKPTSLPSGPTKHHSIPHRSARLRSVRHNLGFRSAQLGPVRLRSAPQHSQLVTATVATIRPVSAPLASTRLDVHLM